MTAKILVADDSLTIQKVIRLALSSEPYEIVTSTEGTDTIQQIALHRPLCVLIDVALPGRDAFQVKEEINRLPDLRATRFILMSGAFENVDQDRVESAHFEGRLTKPFDPTHLRRIISETLQASIMPELPPLHLDLPPLPLTPPPPSEMSALTQSTFDLVEQGKEPDLEPLSLEMPLPPIFEELPLDPPPLRSEAPPPMQVTPPPIHESVSKNEIQDMVRLEVQGFLADMAQKILPDLAETIVKQEIHRLLSEPTSKSP